jgi:hypothetical protein
MKHYQKRKSKINNFCLINKIADNLENKVNQVILEMNNNNLMNMISNSILKMSTWKIISIISLTTENDLK